MDDVIHVKKIIDTPILFDEKDGIVKIFNAGSMNQWVVGYFDGEKELLSAGVFKDIRSNHNVISLEDFIKKYDLDFNSTWSMNCKGFFDDYMVKTIKALPVSGNFVQIYKMLDMVLRRIAIKNKLDEVYYDTKEEKLVYKIISSTDTSKGGIITFTKEIDAILV